MCHGDIILYFPIMRPGIPSWGPPEETSGELLGAPHRSFGPDVLSGTAPAIGEKPPPNYDWLGGFKMLNYFLALFWRPIFQLTRVIRGDDFSALKSPSDWPGRLKRGH